MSDQPTGPSFEQRLQNTSKLLALFIELAKLTGLALLIVAGVITVVFPRQAKEIMNDLGLELREIDAFGIKLVQAKTFDAAENITQAQIGLDDIVPVAEGLDGSARENLLKELDSIKTRLSDAQTVLNKQEAAIKTTKAKSGIQDTEIPVSGWLFVGLVDSNGKFRPAPRISPSGSSIIKEQVSKLLLRYDAPVYATIKCEAIDVSDVQPRDPNSVDVLLRADPPFDLKVMETKHCPRIGGWKEIHAKIQIPPDRVRFAKYTEWK